MLLQVVHGLPLRLIHAYSSSTRLKRLRLTLLGPPAVVEGTALSCVLGRAERIAVRWMVIEGETMQPLACDRAQLLHSTSLTRRIAGGRGSVKERASKKVKERYRDLAHGLLCWAVPPAWPASNQWHKCLSKIGHFKPSEMKGGCHASVRDQSYTTHMD